jgi:hypothetical protein
VRAGEPQCGAAADRVADGHDVREPERLDEAREQRGVTRRARRLAIVSRVAVARPVERDHAVAVAQRGAQPGVVACAVRDRVQAEQHGSAAFVVVREADAVDDDLLPGARGAEPGTGERAGLIVHGAGACHAPAARRINLG